MERFDNEKVVLSDWLSFVTNFMLVNYVKDQKSVSRHIQLPNKMVVDLELLQCRDKNQERMTLVKQQADNRNTFVRPDEGYKSTGKYNFSLNLDQKDKQQAKLNSE